MGAGGSIDLDAYLRRIGDDGPRTPTLDTLRRLHRRHTEAIPFENLSPLLGHPVGLDLPSLEDKLVRAKRGGWCFEQNGLFRAVLAALGFSVRGLGARVLWGWPEAYVGPRSHMVLEVALDGALHLADVGFGGVTLTAPLRLVPGLEQPTPHEPFRLRERAPGDYVLEVQLDAWRPLYRFRLEEQLPADYEVSSWYLCHHPDSFFRRDLVAARPFAGGRFALRNTALTVHRTGEPSRTRTLASADEIRASLERDFLLALPDGADLDAALARIAATPPAPSATPRPAGTMRGPEGGSP